MQAPARPTLERHARTFIVLTSVCQAALLLLAWHLDESDTLSPAALVLWVTLVTAVPTMTTLSVVRIADRRLWQHAVAIAIACAALAGWAAWSVSGAPGIEAGAVLQPFALTLAGALFVALPFLQCRLHSGRWRAAYPELFDHAWQNALSVALAVAFTGVCWLVLTLWAQLFDLVDITFFDELFFEQPWFAYIATGLFLGIGLQVGRTQPQALRVVRRIMFILCRGLLPLAALIALLFLASLPFTGLAPLWAMHSSAGLLLALMMLLATLLNAVWGDGESARAYPRVLRWLVNAALLVSPIYAALALYALALRIDQYGWSGARLFAVLAAVLAAGYGIGCACAVLRRGTGWLAWLPRVNVSMALIAMVLAVLVNSPALDPWRITVASQLNRLQAGVTTPAKLDIRTLRYDSGRRGYEALLALRHDPLIQAHATVSARLTDAINQVQKHAATLGPDEHIRSVTQLRRHLRPAHGNAVPDTSWYAAVLGKRFGYGTCTRTDSRCLVLTTDLRGDGEYQHLLCYYDDGAYRKYSFLQCRITVRNARGQWVVAGRLSFDAASKLDQRRIWKALQAGTITPEPPRWPDVSVAGITAHVTPTQPAHATSVIANP